MSNSYDIIYTSNNSEILITDFTYLNCHTDLRNCCRYSDGSTGLGEWFYPNGRFVPARIYSESFYRSRNAPQVVRLGRHFTDTATDTGLYCCVIPTTIGEQRFCVHLGMPMIHVYCIHVYCVHVYCIHVYCVHVYCVQQEVQGTFYTGM